MFFIEGYVYDNPCDQGEQSPTKYGQRSVGSFEHGRLIQSIVDLLDVLGEEQAFLLDKNIILNLECYTDLLFGLTKDWNKDRTDRY